ncbi:MAG: DUF177 domain-containing protein [Lachnospiraceae bacterium]
MLINLSDVLSEQHKEIDQTVLPEMDDVQMKSGTFRVLSKEPMQIVIEHVKEKQLLIHGKGRIIIEIPCDRCLTAVPTEFKLRIHKTVDLDEAYEERIDELDEKNYIDGYNLDVEKLLYNEILIGWPMKILCSENCKGICSVCGQNLNEGACDCEDTGMDPQMSVIRDVFKNFKEV